MQSSTAQGTTGQAAIPVEEVARFPLPGMAYPTAIEFHPDGHSLTYLFSPQGSLSNQLFRFDLKTGQQTLLAAAPGGGVTDQNVSREEALRRERQRQRATGITGYAWSEQGDRLLIPAQGAVYVAEKGEALRYLAGGQPPALNPHFSPDGRWVSYVQNGEIFVAPSSGGDPRQLTTGAAESGKTHGLAEYIAQEEMDRSRGYWWSPDSRMIAYCEVDETHIPVYRITHQGKSETGLNAQEDHRYPFAGQANVRVGLKIVILASGETIDVLPADESGYLPRIWWLPDGRLSYQTENREQTHLALYAYDTQTRQTRLLLEENSTVWINLHHLFRPLKSGNFLWASERSGYRHLYLYDREGNLIRPLTGGTWMVDHVARVDEPGGWVYFTANRDDPRESQLYRAPLAGGEPEPITREAGTHNVVVDVPGGRFVDTWSAIDRPPLVQVKSLQTGAVLCTVFDRADPRIEALRLRPPELVQLTNRAGVPLYGAVYRPPEQFGAGPFPTVVDVYGGPHVQRVVNAWGITANMRAQYLRSLGFLVFLLDNRGSARRGLAFEGAIRHHVGHVEVEDQVDGARWLVEQGLADPQRVGIYGWSYGGYLAAMCLARAPETFRAAVAGAPVTDWDGYDSHYTERYMGLPQANPEGYRTSAVMAHIETLTGKLLLVHGLIDENVHFRHTARLINALIRARKPYELLLFPDERHMPRGEADRVYMEERIRAFFQDNL